MNEIVEVQQTIYKSRNPTRRHLHTLRRDRIIEQILNSGSLRERALEVGPGSGVYLPILCDLFKSVTAMDIDPAHISNLQSLTCTHPNLTLLQMDIVNQTLAEKYDLVLCSEVIEHVGDPMSFISSLSQLTAPGGVLILSTPQPNSMLELACKIGLKPNIIDLVRRIYQEPVLPTGHISLLSKTDLWRMLEGHGFLIESFDSFGLYIPLLAEFLPKRGADWSKRVEKILHRWGLRELLWTQMFVARKVT
jgi:SAM-dependent methyltransferase